jgi:hypothetical protein
VVNFGTRLAGAGDHGGNLLGCLTQRIVGQMRVTLRRPWLCVTE